ncbi:ABC transporter ATP-binding protein [Ruegeria pomeroyi]|uniref:ABC transporter ATP-binding protein n=1 Tax=Ruegeria pomeroyi TaxID=89184 RepID=UPI001F426411|nr:ABC transporter ATP-binding protein [Ruegeria pomeroyi]MCE8507940.1 ABC transporter ATP-binding protein [Ruegeria pomeroyi]
MLNVTDLRVYHGPIEAVHGITFQVKPGQCVSLLGPNGAGKTSTLSAITGIARATGAIAFDGTDMGGLPVEARMRRGLAISPEGRRVFANLTVTENLRLGAAMRPEGQAERIARWFDTFPILGERRDQQAGTLSGGEQQMLAIARALMSEPRILLLDEPSLGLAPRIVAQIFAMIETLRRQGMTILLVEQNATQALRLSDYAYLLNNGRIVAEGTAGTLGQSDALMAELTGIG